VANNRTVGNDEKSSGLFALSATISTSRLIMTLVIKPMSSSAAGIGTTISATRTSVAIGRTAPRPAFSHNFRTIKDRPMSAAELG
jgi:hypothetical protein